MHCEHHDHDTAPVTAAEKARSERATREDDAYFDGVVRNDPPETIVRHDDVPQQKGPGSLGTFLLSYFPHAAGKPRVSQKL